MSDVLKMRTGRTSRIRRRALEVLKENPSWWETAALAQRIKGVTVADVRPVLHRMADAGEIQRDRPSANVLMWRTREAP